MSIQICSVCGFVHLDDGMASAVYQHMKSSKFGLTARHIADVLGMSIQSASNLIRGLEKLGLVQVTGSEIIIGGGRQKIYELSERLGVKHE